MFVRLRIGVRAPSVGVNNWRGASTAKYTEQSLNTIFFKRKLGEDQSFARGVLEDSKSCQNLSEKDWTLASGFNEGEVFQEEFIEKLIAIPASNNLTLDANEFDEFVDDFVRKVPTLTDAQLMRIIECISQWSGFRNRRKAKNFLELWTALDDQMCDRCWKWDLDQLLHVADIWQQSISWSASTNFFPLACKRVGRKIKGCSIKHLIQISYLMNLLAKPIFDSTHMEQALKQHFDDLTNNQLGLICMALVRCSSHLNSDENIEKLFQRILRTDVRDLNDVSLSYLLKVR